MTLDQEMAVAESGGIGVALIINFMPSMIAFARQHPERRLIGLVVVLMGLGVASTAHAFRRQ